MATMAADQHIPQRSQTTHGVPTDADAWHAVETRDARLDGAFVYAVRSTRIYCRPSCASRRPLRANVSFYPTPDQAEGAGYRACLRCDPRGASGNSSNAKAIDKARAYLDRNIDRVVSLSELASHVGVSASHLQRSFKHVVGVSPKAYQDAGRVSLFKSRLRAGDTVSRATYEAGFGSSSRVYERTDDLLGMTPASYKRGGDGVEIGYTIADAPVGRVLVATTARGVCAVELGATDAEVERALRADFPNATIERNDDAHLTWVRAVLDRVRRPKHDPANRIPLDVAGTAFQRQVWAALQSIPSGERRSYSEVAESLGRPTAMRAVARACATNRVAVVIPCHRVVRAGGELAGYKWGVDRKKKLLAEEAG
ncbi:MAG TPA: bifunctional DNA-binding transcriptional regulator/O6-methylguanine-DNA methyltransferase Ada [Gemmatimonadaceae bacterium]|nr:bifunctional DNA-binding transcriptional regulator/O6-methylguanine-DNA methyltransferase Ada [Gemmatimonadaceae bacterium]